MSSSSRLSSAMARAISEINLQFLARIFTFIFNLIVVRYLSADVLGVINVRLMLLFTTIQFISREPVRRVCLSEAKSSPWPSLVNIMWSNSLFSLAIGYFFCGIWLNFVDKPDPSIGLDYDFAVKLIPIAVTIEMFSEPIFIHLYLNDQHGIRIRIELITLILRCFGMAIFIANYPHKAIFIFSISLLISSIFLTLLYYIYGKKFIRSHSFSQFLPQKHALDFSLIRLTSSFLGHTVVKQLATEGERFIMTFFNPLTLAEQGIFDLVSNLGALPARLIFKPIEDSAYRSFSEIIDREKPSVKQRRDALELESKLLKFSFLLGFAILVFGFNYSRLGLILYNSRILGSDIALNLMRWHCLYDFVIAINGVTESFTLAAMSRKSIDDSIGRLILISVGYILSGITLVTIMGASGLILSNCFGMFFRIWSSLSYLSRWDPGYRFLLIVKRARPTNKVFLSFFFSFVLTRFSEHYLCCENGRNSFVHLIVGAIAFLLVLIVIAWNEPECSELLHNLSEKFPFLRFFGSKSKISKTKKQGKRE
ncbi:man(5)GlcNAc(2)-PP-dolichol translocation protein RFT1 [Brevipalpus obovatus]|uniref:man(5)GlcNAc(2)-PP-dolichol translocation protein RFT1 n=1 Tax=Brevipalpus obovatus TaxID=246614 RepID=UPI003D9F34D3